MKCIRHCYLLLENAYPFKTTSLPACLKIYPTDRWTDGKMNGCLDRWTDEWTDRQTGNWWTDAQTNRQIDECDNRQTEN